MTAVATGQPDEYTVTLSGPDFKGFLFRAELGSAIVDSGIGSEATACADTAVGVTHTSPDLKTEAVAVFLAPTGAVSAVMDVSVVVDAATYYYTGLTVDLAAAAGSESVFATAAPTDGETQADGPGGPGAGGPGAGGPGADGPGAGGPGNNTTETVDPPADPAATETTMETLAPVAMGENATDAPTTGEAGVTMTVGTNAPGAETSAPSGSASNTLVAAATLLVMATVSALF